MTEDEVVLLNAAERSAYANGYGDCRRKFEERPEFNNWMGKPLGDMSRGELIDALAWCVTALRGSTSDRKETIEECAYIAHSCRTGVAVEIDDQRFLMGTQEGTALAIAAAIRALAHSESEGKEES